MLCSFLIYLSHIHCQEDGNIHRYYVVLHARADSSLPYRTSGFYSHISPFSALLNAFRTLSVWKTRFESSSDSSLYAALQAARVPEPQAIVEVMQGILTVLISLKFWLVGNYAKEASGSQGKEAAEGALTNSSKSTVLISTSILVGMAPMTKETQTMVVHTCSRKLWSQSRKATYYL